jgi:hypothetical protein
MHVKLGCALRIHVLAGKETKNILLQPITGVAQPDSEYSKSDVLREVRTMSVAQENVHRHGMIN